jgi:hypothetical protein
MITPRQEEMGDGHLQLRKTLDGEMGMTSSTLEEMRMSTFTFEEMGDGHVHLGSGICGEF